MKDVLNCSAIILLSAAICVPARAASVPPAATTFEATRDRPLFSPTRRPPPPPMPATVASAPAFAPPPAPPPDVVLSGIILGGGTGSAIVRRATDASATRVALGGQVDGWTVSEIRPRSIVLQRGERTVTLDLPGPR